MPAATGGNDFFLSFTSNAEDFGTKLSADLEAPITRINSLRQALELYDAQVNKMSRRGPLADQFAGINSAANRIQIASESLVRGVGAALNGLQVKINQLGQILTIATQRLGGEAAGGTVEPGSNLPPREQRGPYTRSPEEQRAVEIQRAKDAAYAAGATTKAVTEKELAAARATAEAAGKTATATAKVGKESTDLATTINTIVTSFQELAERLKAAELPTGKGKGGGESSAEMQVSGEVQVGNTTSNPVPVIVVGAEAGATGHGSGKQPEHTPRATTATENAKAVAALSPAPERQPRTQGQWEALSPAYRARLTRAGITAEEYVAGVPLGAARGHQTDAAIAAQNAARETPTASNAAAAAAVGSGNEPVVNGRPAKAPPELSFNDREVPPGTQNQLNALDKETQEFLARVRAKLAALAGQSGPAVAAERQRLVAEAGAVFKADSQVRQGATFNRQLFGNAPVRAAFLGDTLGLDINDPKVGQYVRNQVLRAGASADQAAGVVGARVEPKSTAKSDAAVAAAEAQHQARVDEILATTSGKEQRARLAQAMAEGELNKLEASGNATAAQRSRAQIALSTANERLTTVTTPEKSGLESFGFGLGKTSAWALKHTIAYTAVFTGFEKLREVVHTGIEAQAAMVRLNASLQATGKSSDGVAESMAKISANTATPIEHVIEAASELAGVFKNTGDLEFATGVAAQLANISQGLITAREAAIGLRDVTAAYGLQSPKQLQAVGDNIAALSQRTGVSVKDITEGTTQLAQEGNDFGLSQRQTSALAAYITQGTGEPGEAAAEQASRLLSTLYNTKVQNTLVRNNVTDASNFSNGDIAKVLEDLVTKYDKLNPSTRQQIAFQVGSGRQARAFAALTNGGEQFVQEFTGHGNVDAGALGRQNTAVLDQIAGRIKRLSEDFQNLGVALEQAHIFDILGVAASAADELARGLRVVFNVFNSIANANPVTTQLTRITVMILELVAAGKLLRAVFGASLLGRFLGATGTAAAVPAAVTATTAAAAGGAGGAVAAGAAGAGVGAAEGAVEGAAIGATTAGAVAAAPRVLSTAGQVTAMERFVVALEANRITLLAHSAATEADALALTENAIAARAGVLGRLGADGRMITDLTPKYAYASSGATYATTAEETAKWERFAEGGAVGAGAAAGKGGGAIRGALGRFRGFLGRGVAAAPELFGEYGIGISTGLVAAAGGAVVLNGAFNAKHQSEALGKTAGSMLAIVKDKSATGQADTDRIEILYNDALRNGAGTGLSGLAQKASNLSPLNFLGVHFFGNDGGNPNPSQASANLIYGHSSKSRLSDLSEADTILPGEEEKGGIYGEGQRLLKRATKDKSAKELLDAYNKINDEITKHAEEIAKAGGNGPRAQAAVYEELQQTRAGLMEQVDDALKGIHGLHTFTETLSLSQAQLLQAYTQSVGSLSTRTIREQGSALAGLVSNSGTSLGTSEYKTVQELAGEKTVQPSAYEEKIYAAQKADYDKQIADFRKKYQAYQGRLAAYNKSNLKKVNDYTGRDDPLQRYDETDFDYKKMTAGQKNAVENYMAGIGQDLPAGIPLKSGGKTQYSSDDLKRQGGVPIAPVKPDAPIAPQATTVSYELTAVQQQRDLEKLYAAQIKTLSKVAQGIDPTVKPGQKQTKKYTQDQMSQAATQLQTAFQGFQSAQQQAEQIPIQLAAGHAQTLQNVGDYKGSANALKEQSNNLEKINEKLRTTDPEYYQNLNQIQQLQLQIAQTIATPLSHQLQIQAANSLNPIASAAAQYQLAELQIKEAEDAYREELKAARRLIAAKQHQLDALIANLDSLASRDPHFAKLVKDIQRATNAYNALAGTDGNTDAKNAGEVAKESAAASQAQAAEAKNQAEAQAHMAGIRNTKELAQAQLTEALREEAVYRKQGNLAAYYQAVAQATQAEIAIRDSVEQQKESAIKAASTLQSTLKGNAVGAAKDDLKTAQNAYAYAVQEYGRNSQQAEDALGQLYSAQNSVIAAQLAQQNSAIDLQIAKLNFTGGQGDAQRAAIAQVQQAKNSINSYLNKGGKKGTSEYNQLEASLVNAHRNAIDVAVNAQLDTLDFQRETYQITSAQEVRALQQILKNKQLTLAEQRSITLKIKDLQQSIREQLTQGGLNIPSGITLPTAYEVRRSLGAGFGGSGTRVSTVNNNQQVTINNNVPNQQVATAIANQVIQAINKQTGMHLRANSSTPRLVNTR